MTFRLLGAWLVAALLTVGLHAKAPALTDVKVYPADVNLKTRQDRQLLVVQATYADGVTKDVTAQAGITIANKALVKLDRAVLTPVADGTTEVRVKFQGRTLAVPVKVEQANAEEPISFTKDVMPVFTKAGCNTGGCHGSSRGKDGFHLSLFGYDPDGDYFRLTRQMIGRRINLALPEESLLLEKSTNQVPHTGGERFKPDSDLYRTLLTWLKAGAPKDSGEVARVERLEIHPRQSVLEGAGESQQLNVRAFYSDGTDRDVTALTAFMSNNDVAVKVSETGKALAGVRGEAFITARYEGHATGVQVLSIPKDLKFTWPAVAENNYIDGLVNAKLRKLRIAPSEVSDDATFLRRVYLDLTGTLPTPAEVRAFLADSAAGKRDAVIDALMTRKEFVDLWVMKWAELLQIRSADQQLQMSTKSARQYFDWLEDQIARNVPVDAMARTLLTATGPSFEAPAANFYKVERDTLKLSENVAQAFMGVRLQCAQCHNHPFDRWTMNDYYGFAAFFAQIGRKAGEDPRETIVFNNGSGGVKHPVGGKDVAPKFLGGKQPVAAKGADRRQLLAEWMASEENPYFARNLANLVWAHFFGVGIIDPVDDARVSNPPSNPELLDELAARTVRYGYDFKQLVRDICRSRTYQLAAAPNDTNVHDQRNFSRASVRRIRAEVLLDVIGSVTGSTEKIVGLPAGSRAVEIADGRTSTYFLTTFGRATRETPCSCEVKMEPNLSQALHLLNGDTVNAKIANGGLVKKLLKEGWQRDAIIGELYLRTLGRLPTAVETGKLAEFFIEGKSQDVVLNDLFWSLLNAKEFVFNH
ncbi:DUF1549 and DUF1553 domain-containing protein [Horticoccus sp. 23ND18S-11]|uniref:DUF1549 and DUF1553 domain-containing protein n=1 Tax=Horticoccus sp. 23ND18S-11 TaxID=3391832 RepID=UPI0039C9C604